MENLGTVAVGIDIGGTKVAAGVVDDQGRILFNTRAPMNTTGTALETMEPVHTVIRAALAAAPAGVAGIGVASPGPLDLPVGTILRTPNIPSWVDFPLGETIRREYRLPTCVDNDAKAAGLAEALWGAGVGFKSVFYATIGTGIGTAIVIDNHLHAGRTGNAAEGGNMTVDYHAPVTCGSGKPGTIEALASGTGIAHRARKLAIEEGSRSAMLTLAGGDPMAITAKTVEQAWRAYDPAATKVLTETAELITVWLGDIVDLLEPDIIILGGGVGELLSHWFGYIRERLPEWTINSRCEEILITKPRFGVDAGVAGAAALCFQPGRKLC